MTIEERPSFGAAEIIEIASKFAAEEEAFIIGGQATNFLGAALSGQRPRSQAEGPFVQAMAEHPILIERPVVRTRKGTRLCRPPERVKEIL